MRLIIIFISFFLTQFSFGQAKDDWIRFYDTTSELSGYKDLKGKIKIPAKFDVFTRADTFHHIIAVSEQIDSSYKSYYLLKNGRKVGQDSVFVFDFTGDCESEGKILFTDRKTNRVGFFDKNGKVIIPAIYNVASPFRNGMAVALKNAKRKCWGENEDTLNCEHLSWSGGETVLINDKNEVLVDNVTEDISNINWYSLRINDRNADTSISVTLRGSNGNSYSFLDYGKEFRKWFNSAFNTALGVAGNTRLKEMLYPEISFSSKGSGWTSLSRSGFLRSFPAILSKERFLKNTLKQVTIMEEDLDMLVSENNERYKRFYYACGSHNREMFPVFDVMLTYYKTRVKELRLTPPSGSKPGAWEVSDFDRKYELDYQEHFAFIRTEEGYRLLQISIKE